MAVPNVCTPPTFLQLSILQSCLCSEISIKTQKAGGLESFWTAEQVLAHRRVVRHSSMQMEVLCLGPSQTPPYVALHLGVYLLPLKYPL